MIRCDTVSDTINYIYVRSKAETGSQLNLPHGAKKIKRVMNKTINNKKASIR